MTVFFARRVPSLPRRPAFNPKRVVLMSAKATMLAGSRSSSETSGETPFAEEQNPTIVLEEPVITRDEELPVVVVRRSVQLEDSGLDRWRQIEGIRLVIELTGVIHEPRSRIRGVIERETRDEE